MDEWKIIVAWRGVGSDGVSDLTDRQDIADQWLADGIEVTPLVSALSIPTKVVAWFHKDDFTCPISIDENFRLWHEKTGDWSAPLYVTPPKDAT